MKGCRDSQISINGNKLTFQTDLLAGGMKIRFIFSPIHFLTYARTRTLTNTHTLFPLHSFSPKQSSHLHSIVDQISMFAKDSFWRPG